MLNYEEAKLVRNKFTDILEKELTTDSVVKAIECIRIIGEIDGDDESAHSMESKLRVAVLKQINHPLGNLVLMTDDIKFSRWYA